jgi:hypothetical protein
MVLGRRDELFGMQDALYERQSGLKLAFAYLAEMRNDRRQVEEMQSDTMEPGSKCPTVTS